MGLLADIFSYGDGMKRKVNGLLQDPMGTASLGATRMAEDQNSLLALMDQAGYTPGSKSVLQTQQGQQQARNSLADKALESFGGLLGAAGKIAQNRPHGIASMTQPKVQDDALKLAKDLERLTEQHGDLYVRWSPSLKGDLQPGRVSRDFVSGSTHAGLSASPITPDMHHVDILKRVNEYNFLGASHRPHIYKADKIGVDSDGYASITNLKPIREFTDQEVSGLRAGWSDVLDLADNADRARRQLEKFGGKSEVWSGELEKANAALEKAVAKVLERNGQPIK